MANAMALSVRKDSGDEADFSSIATAMLKGLGMVILYTATFRCEVWAFDDEGPWKREEDAWWIDGLEEPL